MLHILLPVSSVSRCVLVVLVDVALAFVSFSSSSFLFCFHFVYAKERGQEESKQKCARVPIVFGASIVCILIQQPFIFSAHSLPCHSIEIRAA